uniref:Sugar phosphate transporter domain-containing protein n=1 Tax=Aegilops tauschii TaxID=37682 RepID=R7WE96_AEGTA
MQRQQTQPGARAPAAGRTDDPTRVAPPAKSHRRSGRQAAGQVRSGGGGGDLSLRSWLRRRHAGGGRAGRGDRGGGGVYFRQRSMHAADPDRKAFDVENPPGASVGAAGAGAGGGLGLGLRPSESVAKLESLERAPGGGSGRGRRPSEPVAKLESLERAERAALAPAVVLKTGFYILVWYTFSTCLTLYNKTLLGDKLGKFPAPLLMNTVHFALQAALSKIILLFQAKGIDSAVEMSWKDYFMRVVPTALGTALDINLSNASLVFITVTFATMCKSASPIFLLLFAFAFRLESPSIKLLGIIVVISIGVLLTVARETAFDFWGFIFVTLAAVMSGFRWSMTQILLQEFMSSITHLPLAGLKDPITLMSHVTPVMAIATMVLTEYILVSATSAITVTIAGVVKEAVTILDEVAVFYFHDEFTWLKGVGLTTTMVGVSLFNWYNLHILLGNATELRQAEPLPFGQCYNTYLSQKYEKFKKGQINEDGVDSPSFSGDAKYIILDDLEDEDGFLDEDT